MLWPCLLLVAIWLPAFGMALAAPAGERGEASSIEAIAALPQNALAIEIIALDRNELEALSKVAYADARQRTGDTVRLLQARPDPLDGQASSKQSLDRQRQHERQMVHRLQLREQAFDRLSLILDEWKLKGGDPEKIEEYRTYVRAVVRDSVRVASFSGLWKLMGEWLRSPSGGVQLIQRIAIFIVAFMALAIFAYIVSILVRAILVRVRRVSKLLERFLSLAVFWLILVIGFAFILVELGLSLGPILAIMGGASFVIAFALQETLGNFAAGLMILIYRPFDRGERIMAANVDGHVRDVNLTATTLITPDHQLVTIPNSKVWNDVIFNATQLGKRRIDLAFVIESPDQALSMMGSLPDILNSHPDVMADPGPELYIADYTGRGATLQVRPWVESTRYWPARRSITQMLMQHFAREEIRLWEPPIERIE